MTRPRLNGELDSIGTMSRQSPSGAQPAPLKRIAREVLACIGISLCFMPNAGSAIPMQQDKPLTPREYAAILVDDKKQMKCLGLLYGKESAWNPDARSGSHYGIPQGRSIYLKTATIEQQIQWGLKYIDNRYGSPCKAWAFFQANNYH
jgi:hypothetical protein